MGASTRLLALAGFCVHLSDVAAAGKSTHGFLAASGEGQRCDQIPTTYKVVAKKKLPHLEKPFTQGLEFATDGTLIETSGSFPPPTKSYVRGVNPETGDTLWRTDEGLNGAFIEGVTRLGAEGHWFSTVYQEPHLALEYDEDFNYLRSYEYFFDGWGFTHTLDGSAFLATNGSSEVMQLDPATFKVQRSARATCLCEYVPALNELELVEDFMGKGPALLGNVYTSRVVLALDPQTMGCIGAFNLRGLDEPITLNEKSGYHVANGIAYRKSTNTYFLTGKNWDSMFEVELQDDPEDDSITQLQVWLESTHTAPGILSLIAMDIKRQTMAI